MEVFETIESNVRNYSRHFPVVFDRAEGAVIIDENGHEFIDFFAGAGALNYGHNHPEVNQAIIDYIGQSGITLSLDMATVAKRNFLITFHELILIPRGLHYKIQFTGPTGANAVEAAIKLARTTKKRKNIVAFTNAFHGMSSGALALTGNSFYHNSYYSSRQNVVHMPYEGYLPGMDSIAYIRKLLEDSSSGMDIPAAFIVETIQCEGGINVASIQWLQSLYAICKEFGILLIIDDIQTGNGRTGQFFSFEHAGLTPDFVCLSKSIGCGFPMSLLLIKPEADQWQPGEHSGTFRGNNLSMVASTQILNHYWRNRDFEVELKEKEKIISGFLTNLITERPELGMKMRGRGLVWGLVLPTAEMAAAIRDVAFKKRLLIETCGNEKVIKIMPPLIIDDTLLYTGMNNLREAIDEICVY